VKNKKPVGFAAIIIAILVLAPYFEGHYAKENIEQSIAKISHIPGYALEIRDYDQGWFTSHAVVKYGFDDHTLNMLMGSKDVTPETLTLLQEGLVFDVTVAHGPITFQNGLNFSLLTLSGTLRDLNHPIYKDFKERAKFDSLLKLFMSVSYGGAAEITANIPTVSLNNIEMTKTKVVSLDFSGMTMEASLNSSLNELKTVTSLPQLTINSAETVFSLGGFNLTSNSTKLNEYVWLGKGDFSVDHFKIKDISKDLSFSLDKVISKYDLRKEDQTNLMMTMAYNIKEIIVGDVALNDIQLTADISHMNAEAITDYTASVQGLYQGNQGRKPTDKEYAEKVKAIAIRVGEKIIQGSPELVIKNLHFLTGGGYFDSDAKIALNGKDLENIQTLSDPIALNKRLSATVNIKFDRPLAVALSAIGFKRQLIKSGVDLAAMPPEQLEKMINLQTDAALKSFIDTGSLIQKDTAYFTHIEMKDGKKMVNGKVMAIPGM